MGNPPTLYIYHLDAIWGIHYVNGCRCENHRTKWEHVQLATFDYEGNWTSMRGIMYVIMNKKCGYITYKKIKVSIAGKTDASKHIVGCEQTLVVYHRIIQTREPWLFQLFSLNWVDRQFARIPSWLMAKSCLNQDCNPHHPFAFRRKNPIG